MNENETFITLGLLGELGHVNVSLSLLLRRGHCKCNAREIGIGFFFKKRKLCYVLFFKGGWNESGAKEKEGFYIELLGEGGGDVKDRASWGKQKTGSGPSVWEGLFQCVSALFGDLVIYFIFRGGYCHACLPACACPALLLELESDAILFLFLFIF